MLDLLQILILQPPCLRPSFLHPKPQKIMATYKSVVLAKRPTAGIEKGQTFALKTQPAPSESSLKDGQVLLSTLYLSLDPAMRGWLNDSRSYIPPVQIGEVMRGGVLARVTASKSADLPVGTLVSAETGWTELAVAKAKHCQKLDLPHNARATDALGVLGLTGLTAYFGLLDIGRPKAGDLVVVSGAAGATGSVVGQIAKLKGARVIGIAGSDDKVAWLKDSLGFDDALNYKSPTFKQDFRAATKSYIDVFFDNVGGEVSTRDPSKPKPKSKSTSASAVPFLRTSKSHSTTTH